LDTTATYYDDDNVVVPLSRPPGSVAISPTSSEDPPGSYATYKASTTPFGLLNQTDRVYSDTRFYFQKQYNDDGSRDNSINDMICFVGSVTGYRPNIQSIHGDSSVHGSGFGGFGSIGSSGTDCSAKYGCGVHINSGFDCQNIETQGTLRILISFVLNNRCMLCVFDVISISKSKVFFRCSLYNIIKQVFIIISKMHSLLVLIHGKQLVWNQQTRMDMDNIQHVSIQDLI